MSEAQAEISEQRRISAVWLVPIVALLLGVWMVVYTLRSQGPEITIVFSSAEGIEPGKTKIKALSVEVGVVESVGLSDDLERVMVVARLERSATPLLREDTQFWVVRARIGAGGVSGLSTVLSGGFIELSPGVGAPGRRDFAGLEDPPVTPTGTPGLHFDLVSDQAGSVGTGNPILYKGFRVGRIESAEFDVASQEMRYRGFIEAPYDDLVNANSRFWNASGISVNVGAEGIELDTGSLESILLGGIAFGLPEGIEAGEAVADETSFVLYPSYASVNERPYRESLEYVLQFSQSVRGLHPGAPVEYLGVRVGQVERILLEEFAFDINGDNQEIPVLIRLEPGRLALPDTPRGSEQLTEAINTGVAAGVRAALATGSLLTGGLYVSFDVYPEAPAAEIGRYAGRPTFPTTAGGFAGIQRMLTSFLDKVNALPLEGTVEAATRLLANLDAIAGSPSARDLPASLDSSLAELRTTLASVSADSALQERLRRTLVELDRTLQSLRSVLDTLEEKPNALIFDYEPGPDPAPSAGSQ